MFHYIQLMLLLNVVISPDETKNSTCNTDAIQREAIIQDISVRNVRSDQLIYFRYSLCMFKSIKSVLST